MLNFSKLSKTGVAIAATIAAFMLFEPAVSAQSVIADLSGSLRAVIGAFSGMVQGSSITRPANVTPYAANQTVCAATSVTVTSCVPGTIPISNIGGGRLANKRVTLLKSGPTTTNANFTIWFYSASPGVASPLQLDGTSYTGPRAADMPNFLGSAACNGGTATSDTNPGVWYECNPVTGIVLQATKESFPTLATKNVLFLISATAAYTPATSETLTPFVGGQY